MRRLDGRGLYAQGFVVWRRSQYCGPLSLAAVALRHQRGANTSRRCLQTDKEPSDPGRFKNWVKSKFAKINTLMEGVLKQQVGVGRVPVS